MAITKEISRLEHSRIKLTVTVDREEVRARYDETVSGYRKTLQIPGFRKGKVPTDVLERKLGDTLKGEVLGKIIESSLTGIMEDEGFPKENHPLPYSTPELEGEPSLDLASDLSFSVVYDAMPPVTLGAWKGLEAEIPEAALTDEDINRELEAIRERNAIVLDKDDDAPAEKGDVVTVNYAEISDSGELIEGSAREDFVFTLGSGHNIFHFDDEVLGMKKGETRDIEKSYPDGFEDPALAGKTKKIRVSLTALKEKNLPELDDDLAQDVDEKFETLEDLKQSLRDRMTRALENQIRVLKVNRILEKIMETTPLEIPESMIRVELDSRWRNFARQYHTTVEQMDAIMAVSGGTEGIKEQWRPDVIRALHSRLIVDALIRELGFDASEEELEAEYGKIAESGNLPLEDVKKYYSEDTAQTYLKEDIKEQKVFDLLIAENKFISGPARNYLDLMENNG
ncbi:MAG: trigger factor [Spirochaetaceae bacterium]|nr:trigger factor [Spirochaetaceae bacterium]